MKKQNYSMLLKLFQLYLEKYFIFISFTKRINDEKSNFAINRYILLFEGIYFLANLKIWLRSN